MENKEEMIKEISSISSRLDKLESVIYKSSEKEYISFVESTKDVEYRIKRTHDIIEALIPYINGIHLVDTFNTERYKDVSKGFTLKEQTAFINNKSYIDLVNISKLEITDTGILNIVYFGGLNILT